MTSFPACDRIETAIRLGKPDRVPVVPIIDIFAAQYGGITQHDMLFDVRKSDMALLKTMQDLGWIDGMSLSYGGMGNILQIILPVPPKLPGVDGNPADALWQFMEKTIMQPDEYGQIEERGAIPWMWEKIITNHPHLLTPTAPFWAVYHALVDGLRIRRSVRDWRRLGVESLVATNITFTPMEWISLTLRSFNDFLLDLYRYPNQVKFASRALMGLFKFIGVATTHLSGVRRVFLGGTRTSAASLSPRHFEEFALPEWLEMVEFFTGKGITPLLHWDSDWTAFFPYLKEFPRGKCILNLDGASDIFKAKEVLGDHMCIMGDVPATLLKLGEPEEVDAYCERLIKELGADGGFILSSGCTVPIDARPDNVKAMLNSVHRYRP